MIVITVNLMLFFRLSISLCKSTETYILVTKMTSTYLMLLIQCYLRLNQTILYPYDNLLSEVGSNRNFSFIQ